MQKTTALIETNQAVNSSRSIPSCGSGLLSGCHHAAKALAIIAIFLIGSVARADVTWNWSLTNGIVGSGQFVTSDLSLGSYLMTSITGEINGYAITGLIPVGSFNGNDNQILPGYPQVDQTGYSFYGSSYQYNLYGVISPSDTYNMTTTDPLGTSIPDVTFYADQVPEPSSRTLLGMSLGVLALWIAVRRRELHRYPRTLFDSII